MTNRLPINIHSRVPPGPRPMSSAPAPRQWLPPAEACAFILKVGLLSSVFWWVVWQMPDYAPGATEMRHLLDRVVW